MQSKKHSLIESITNTIVGLILSFILQLFMYDLLEIEVKLYQNGIITLFFFCVSILRNYLIRRVFEN